MRLLESGRWVVARIPRVVRTGVIVALLAVFTLGGVSVIGVGRFAVPTAHAASGCIFQMLTDQTITLAPVDMKGLAGVELDGYYDSNEVYCGYMRIQAFDILDAGSRAGYVWGGLYDCNSHLIAGSNVVKTTGNGTTNDVYLFTTSWASGPLTCGFGLVETWTYPSPGNKAYEQVATQLYYGPTQQIVY